MDANVAIDASLGPDYPMSTVECIEDYGLCRGRIEIEEFDLIDLLVVVVDWLKCLRLIPESICLGSYGSVEEEDMRKKVVEHVAEVLDIALVDESLFGVEILDSGLERGTPW